jgi:UDP-GlcNAc:undecaprenyl-phosphate/decaprenyl-phosphate GlcNAc-1-phosphate transferase
VVFPNLRYAIPFFCGVVFTLSFSPLVRRAAFWLGAIDQPGERRIHSVTMPRFGGPVIYLALALSLAPVVYLDVFVNHLLLGRAETIPLILAATLVLGIGVLDDCRSASPWLKLLVEIAAAAMVVEAGFKIKAIFGYELGWMSAPVSILWIITVVNGVNLIDGLDGLAVGASLISSATLFAVSLYLRDVSTGLILAALCGTLVGFLYYNFYPARFFLGDSGALLIGFVIAVIAIQSSSKLATVVAILAPATALGLPLVEVILTTLRRMLRVLPTESKEPGARDGLTAPRRPGLFTADREHIHHRLLALGLTHRAVVMLLYGVCLTFAVLTFLLCYQRINIILILAGAAAAAGALIPRLDRGPAASPIAAARVPFADFFGDKRWLQYMFLNLGLVIASWLGTLLYNRSSAGPALPHLSEVGPWIVLAQMVVFYVVESDTRGVGRFIGLHELLAIVKLVVGATVATTIVLAISRAEHSIPLRIVAVNSYLLGTLMLASLWALRVLQYLVGRDVSTQVRA